MAVQLAIALATLLVEDEHFVTLHQGTNYLGYNLGTLNLGSTNGDGTVIIYQQHSLKLNSLASLCTLDVVYKEFLAGFRTELLTVNLYDCVHCFNYLFLTGFTGRRNSTLESSLLSPFGIIGCKGTNK